MNDFPLLRASLAPQFADLSGSELTALVQAIYGSEATAEDVEGLFGDIGRGLSHAARSVGRFAQQAAPVLAKALPNVASGAAGGAAFGPWGALIGAGAGLASGLLSQSGNRTARSIGGTIHNVGGLVSTVRGGGATGALGSLSSIASGALGHTPAGRFALGQLAGQRGGQAGAANMLAGLLSRPELTHALTASLMGASGRQAIPIAGQQVSISQLLSALSNVAGRAAHEAADIEGNAEATPEYALYGAEAFGIDPEQADERSDALLTLLALTPSIWMNARPAPITVQINPGDPFFPTGEDWGGEGWDGEAIETDWEDWNNGTEAWNDESDESDESDEAEAWANDYV